METSNDVIFTMESSIRTSRIAVYTLLGLHKVVPDISPVQYDIRTLLKAARTVNNNEPFIGERLLHRLLDRSYFANILPPLPESPEKARLESEAASIMGKGEMAAKAALAWIEGVRNGLKK